MFFFVIQVRKWLKTCNCDIRGSESFMRIRGWETAYFCAVHHQHALTINSNSDELSSGTAYLHHGVGVAHPSRQSPSRPPLIHETEFPASAVTPSNLPASGDSGASVNSDYSSGGNSCSTADRSPPYLPRNPSNSVKRSGGRVRQKEHSVCSAE